MHGLLLWVPWCIGVANIVGCAIAAVVIALAMRAGARAEGDLTRPAPPGHAPEQGAHTRAGSDDLRCRSLKLAEEPLTDRQLARLQEALCESAWYDEDAG